MVWVGGDGDTHPLNQAGVVGDGEHGGNAEVQICVVAVGEGVGDFHTRLIQSSKVVTMNL